MPDLQVPGARFEREDREVFLGLARVISGTPTVEAFDLAATSFKS